MMNSGELQKKEKKKSASGIMKAILHLYTSHLILSTLTTHFQKHDTFWNDDHPLKSLICESNFFLQSIICNICLGSTVCDKSPSEHSIS